MQQVFAGRKVPGIGLSGSGSFRKGQPDADDLGPAADADGRAPGARAARHVILRIAFTKIAPIELVDAAVDDVNREELTVVGVP